MIIYIFCELRVFFLNYKHIVFKKENFNCVTAICRNVRLLRLLMQFSFVLSGFHQSRKSLRKKSTLFEQVNSKKIYLVEN